MKNKNGITVYAVALCAILLSLCVGAIAVAYRCVYDRQTQEGKIQIYKNLYGGYIPLILKIITPIIIIVKIWGNVL